MRSNLLPLVVFRTLSTVRFMSVKTPMLDRIIHNAATITSATIPTATENRNDSFMTVHGSTRETLSLTRRGARGRALPGRVGEPPVLTGSGEPSARTAVPVGPTALTRYLLSRRPQCHRQRRRCPHYCRPNQGQTLRHRALLRLQTRCPSQSVGLCPLSHLCPVLRPAGCPLRHPGHCPAPRRYLGPRCVPPQRSSRACQVSRTARPWCYGRCGAPRRPGSGLSCPSPSPP